MMFGGYFLDMLPFEPVHAQRFGAHGQRRIADFATKGGDDLIRERAWLGSGMRPV
jgi:hypothetical protein